MHPATVSALVLALASTVLTQVAYLRQHDAAAALPVLSMRRPVHSLQLLLHDRSWMLGFALEGVGFLLYAAALSLGPLALVQSVLAGGIGVLAFLTERMGRRRLGRRERSGALVAVFGLLLLSVSLIGGSSEGKPGSTAQILLWLGSSGAVAVLVFVFGRRLIGQALACAIAGGLAFSVGDIATKVATQGGWRLAFVVPLVVGYALGTALLQIGYQAGAALTVAGIATLLTNALPIAAGTVVLDEPVPAGAYGVLRVAAFVAVVAGAILLASPAKAPGPTATTPDPS